MPAPGEILVMHGVAPDLVYAAGRNGLFARWDGSRWTKVGIPDVGIYGVWVVSEDEMYAVGTGGRLLQGSTQSWGEVLSGADPLLGVVKWKGEVWIAAEERGVLKLVGATLVPVKPNIKAT